MGLCNIQYCKFLWYLHPFILFLLDHATCRIYPNQGLNAGILAMKMLSPIHWTAREFPLIFLFKKFKCLIPFMYPVSTMSSFSQQKKKLENRVILTSFSFLIYTVNPKRFLCLHNFKNKLIFFLPILLLSDLTGSTLCSFWPLVISPAYSL